MNIYISLCFVWALFSVCMNRKINSNTVIKKDIFCFILNLILFPICVLLALRLHWKNGSKK